MILPSGPPLVDIRSNGVTYVDKDGVQNDVSADTVVAALVSRLVSSFQ
jgi:hypothetical protein